MALCGCFSQLDVCVITFIYCTELILTAKLKLYVHQYNLHLVGSHTKYCECNDKDLAREPSTSCMSCYSLVHWGVACETNPVIHVHVGYNYYYATSLGISDYHAY